MKMNSNINNVNNNIPNTDSSISLTFSDSNDSHQDTNTYNNQNELEISYKSAFCTDKKCTTPFEQKLISKQIECQTTLFQNENNQSPKLHKYATGTNISTKQTSTTNHKSDSQYETDNKIPSFKKEEKYMQTGKNNIIDIIEDNSNKVVIKNEHEKHHQLKRSKSSIFDIDLNKIKINSLKNSNDCFLVSSNHIRGSPNINNSNPFINKNNHTISYNNKNKEASNINKKHKKLILKKAKVPTSFLPINKTLSTQRASLHTYLEQIINKCSIASSQINKFSQKTKLLKRNNHSHSQRKKSQLDSILSNNSTLSKQKQSTTILKNTSSSCLLIKSKPKNLKTSKSTLSVFNSSSCFKNKRNCFNNTLNTPKNVESKNDSRNSIFKQKINSVNKKQYSSHHLISSFRNSIISQRNTNKKIYIQSPHNIFNKKNLVSFTKDNFKTNSSPPNKSELNIKIQLTTSKSNYTINNNSNNNRTNVNTVTKCRVNNNTTTCSSCSSNKRKSVKTINNFSKYIKKNSKKGNNQNLYEELFSHNKHDALKIYLKAIKGDVDFATLQIKKTRSHSKCKNLLRETYIHY